MKKGTRFLITSRDYIWNSAKSELKLQAFPILKRSQVIINVHDLTLEEKARILYNHLKLGDQDKDFRERIRDFLPDVAKADSFLLESARRLGTKIFTDELRATQSGIIDFFQRPTEFLEQTIEGLSPDAKAAIALVFLNGGTVRSPVPLEKLDMPSEAFGARPSQTRAELQSLNGSILNLAEDEDGPYWTYRHPTVGDAFASYIAKSPELVELYLRGAKPDTILDEVVCAGVQLRGAPVTVPSSLNKLLVQRISSLDSISLGIFIGYRANKAVAKLLLNERPDLFKRVDYISSPIRDDVDSDFVIALHRDGLLSEEDRLKYVEIVRRSAVEDADDSLIEVPAIGAVLTEGEYSDILQEVRDTWLNDVPSFVDKLKGQWENDYSPDDYFDRFKNSTTRFAKALAAQVDVDAITHSLERSVRSAITEMHLNYQEGPTTAAPLQQSKSKKDSLEELFRDVGD